MLFLCCACSIEAGHGAAWEIAQSLAIEGQRRGDECYPCWDLGSVSRSPPIVSQFASKSTSPEINSSAVVVNPNGILQ